LKPWHVIKSPSTASPTAMGGSLGCDRLDAEVELSELNYALRGTLGPGTCILVTALSALGAVRLGRGWIRRRLDRRLANAVQRRGLGPADL